VASASGETFTAPVVTGGSFHALLPRRVNTYENTAAEAT
jgi:hypothetical protein